MVKCINVALSFAAKEKIFFAIAFCANLPWFSQIDWRTTSDLEKQLAMIITIVIDVAVYSVNLPLCDIISYFNVPAQLTDLWVSTYVSNHNHQQQAWHTDSLLDCVAIILDNLSSSHVTMSSVQPH